MQHIDLRNKLEELGATPEQVGGAIRVRPRRVRAWLSGEKALPEVRREQIEWFIEHWPREQALASPDIPRCEWIDNWQPPPMDSGLRAMLQARKELETHPLSCEVCQAQAEYLDSRFGPETPFPSPPSWIGPATRAFEAAAFLLVLLPAPFIGAFVLVALVGPPGLLVWLVSIVLQPASAIETLAYLLRVVGLAAVFGASGGVMFSVVRPFTRQLGTLGEYLTGIACLFGYLVALVWCAPLIEEDMGTAGFGLGHPFAWAFILFGSVFFGCAATWGWRRHAHAPD
jgi:hypothetical protein